MSDSARLLSAEMFQSASREVTLAVQYLALDTEPKVFRTSAPNRIAWKPLEINTRTVPIESIGKNKRKNETIRQCVEKHN